MVARFFFFPPLRTTCQLGGLPKTMAMLLLLAALVTMYDRTLFRVLSLFSSASFHVVVVVVAGDVAWAGKTSAKT